MHSGCSRKCPIQIRTFVIKACGGLLSLDEGQKVHVKLSKVGLDLHVYDGNSFCTAYAKLGCIESAERVLET